MLDPLPAPRNTQLPPGSERLRLVEGGKLSKMRRLARLRDAHAPITNFVFHPPPGNGSLVLIPEAHLGEV